MHFDRPRIEALRGRRYFSEAAARNLIGRRVQARCAIIRRLTPSSETRLIVTAGSLGTVTQFAFGPSRDEFLVGVRWDDPRPSIPRRPSYPIDWYTEDEFRALLVKARTNGLMSAASRLSTKAHRREVVG